LHGKSNGQQDAAKKDYSDRLFTHLIDLIKNIT